MPTVTFNPKFTITPKVNKALVEIERVRGFLDAVKLKDDWLADMQKKALILESHHSTHIEGTALSLEQAQSILEGKKLKGINRDDEKELLNYKKAMDFIAKYIGKDDPIAEGIIRELHKITVKGVRGDKADPGNYRKIQNYVVNSLTREIIYTPPGPLEVPHLMREFVDWTNRIEDMSPVLTAGIAQFQFVHIHPFIDGNGRTARLLSTLILYKTGYDFKRLFSISEYYDKDRPGYYKAIQTVRNNNMDMTVWLEYFVTGLRSQMEEIQEKGKQIIKQDTALQKIKRAGLNARQEKAVKYLLRKGSISVKEYQSAVSCIRRTAQRDLDNLMEKGIIKTVAKSQTDPTKHYVLL
ncbi:MAG: Fic family protein [Planctomycetia bacterium]|nr:Fic family protein [Candidatus Brocadia sp.]QOJ07259.1 MAG: Fic family protein [Planctomycetia bacterium]TVL94586.1 MAG: Fic family protein [Candidatus Brocadia sp. BL1]HQU32616.1 Fic family protein [Candidatus Brocadia sapporoensis]